MIHPLWIYIEKRRLTDDPSCPWQLIRPPVWVRDDMRLVDPEIAVINERLLYILILRYMPADHEYRWYPVFNY
jgi:hypothetical protein